MQPVSIYSTSIFSCAGSKAGDLLAYLSIPSQPPFSLEDDVYLGRLKEAENQVLKNIAQRNKFCSRLDRSLLLAIACGEELLNDRIREHIDGHNLPLVAGSARGSIQTIENFHQEYLENKRAKLLASPMTTPGFMASATAQALGTQGGAYYLSSACLTSLQSLHLGALLANSQIQKTSLLASGVLVVGAESCLTPYYIAQLSALGVLAKGQRHNEDAGEGTIDDPGFISCPFHPKRTGLVLAEGAAGVILAAGQVANKKPLAKILGFGFRSESSSLTGISPQGSALQLSILDACQVSGLHPSEIDVIIAHGSGTRAGDAAEIHAYEKVFCERRPFLCSFKWLLGHTLGASSLMSTVIGVEMLQGSIAPPIPYLAQTAKPPKKIKNVLITALGFGGQSGAMIVQSV